MKNRTKANQLTNELIRLKLLNKKNKTKIIPFGDNATFCFPDWQLGEEDLDLVLKQNALS
ncbi:hypothetical protein ACOWO9_04615 [Leuconostoc mesenteroides]|uniref:hypothetical protein n=1 Tax=Leuconostoc mesenteroides TaxID=1245 RepID=UPI003C39B60D